MTTKQSTATRAEIQAELASIKAQHSQLKMMIVDLGRRAAICQKQILDLAPEPRTDVRMR